MGQSLLFITNGAHASDLFIFGGRLYYTRWLPGYAITSDSREIPC